MALEEAKEFLKKHWPLVAGGVAAVYLLYTYMGSSSSASSGNAATTQASSANTSLQSQSLNNQATATAQAAEVAQTQAVGSAIGSIGSAIATTIAAQSYLPAQAINAASINNQSALMGAAMVAAQGLSSLPGDITAASNAVSASYIPLSIFGSTLIGLNDHIGALGQSAVNAVGQSVAGSAGSAAQSAAASAQANAQATGAIAGAVSNTATTVAMA
jgi:hypothetical protein